MTLGVRDLLYIVAYFASIISVYFITRNKVNNLERDSRLFKKILYKERGSLNLIDVETCKKHRDEVFAAIRRGERVSEMLLKNIEELNRNVLTIMISLDIRGPNGLKIPKKTGDNGD